MMAPTRDLESTRFGSYTKKTNNMTCHQKPPKLSMESLQRTISDISLELSKEADHIKVLQQQAAGLPPISELVEDAKCECCGMCEECTPEYISRVRDKFSGKLICGLCSEAVKEEMEKNGGKREEALSEHMSACSRFNRFGRTHPVLFQAQAMKEILKKSCSSRAKSLSPRDPTKGDHVSKKGGIARSSSCILGSLVIVQFECLLKQLQFQPYVQNLKPNLLSHYHSCSLQFSKLQGEDVCTSPTCSLSDLPIYHLHNQGVVCQAQNAGKEVSLLWQEWKFLFQN